MLEGLTPPRTATVYCKVAQIAESLEAKDSEIFMGAIDNPLAWGARTLSTALRNRGVSIADTTITKHRSRGCACYRQ